MSECTAFIDEIPEFLGKDELRTSQFAKRGGIWIIEIDQADVKRLRPIVTILLTMLIADLQRVANESITGCLPHKTVIIVDELMASGPVPGLAEALHTCRELNFCFVAGAQSLSQLSTIYRDEAQTVLDGFQTQIAMGGGLDHVTADYFSRRSGVGTIALPGVQEPTGSGDTAFSRSWQMVSRQMLLPSDVASPSHNPQLGMPATIIIGNDRTPSFQAFLTPCYNEGALARMMEEATSCEADDDLRKTPLKNRRRLGVVTSPKSSRPSTPLPAGITNTVGWTDQSVLAGCLRRVRAGEKHKKTKDLKGQKFGKLVVMKFAGYRLTSEGTQRARWLCQCACGRQHTVDAGNVLSGNCTSCGCALTDYHTSGKDGRHPRTKDRLGMTYGRLTVVEWAGYKPRASSMIANWTCTCSCGNRKTVAATDLNGNHLHSCGCYIRENCRRVGKSGRLADQVGEKRCLFRANKKGAAKRGYTWSLSFDEFCQLTAEKCAYCQVEPSRTSVLSEWSLPLTYNGVDRLDNLQGYTIANCVTACSSCNFAKGGRSIADFRFWLKQLGDFRRADNQERRDVRLGAIRHIAREFPYRQISKPSWLPLRERSWHNAYSQYKGNAKSRNLLFSISIELAFHLFSQPCFYCGHTSVQNAEGANSFALGGIDRLDNTRGYLSDNCVPCCIHCNLAKHTQSREDFANWLDRVSSVY